MSANDFEIGGKKFKMSKVDAFKQFHITRRMGPLLADFIPIMGEIAKVHKAEKDMSETDKLEEFGKLAAPLMTGLSKLTDVDADYVLFGLLGSVEVQQATGNWARVASSNMLMIQDMELPVLLQIAGRAFMYNLSGFFAALPQR